MVGHSFSFSQGSPQHVKFTANYKFREAGYEPAKHTLRVKHF